MLKKLLKFDFKNILKLALPLYGLGIVATILGTVANNIILNSDVAETTLEIIFMVITTLVVSICTYAVNIIPFAIFIFIVKDFYNSVFAKQGYLTHTLPVSTAEIFWSKTITAVVMTFVSGLVTMGLSVVSILPEIDQLFSDMNEIRSLLTLEWNYIISMVTMIVILWIPLTIMLVFASIALGHLTKNKGTMGWVFYLILSNITGFLALVTPILYLVFTEINRGSSELSFGMELGHALLMANGIILAITIILGLTTHKIMNKKLNLV